MSNESIPELETDPRFPSGPWTGYFLQRQIPGKHLMELRLTFIKGSMTGEGRDWVGDFVIRGGSGLFFVTQGGNQAVDCIRALADNNPILRLRLTQRASLQQERAVVDRRDRLSVAVSLIDEMDCQTRFRQCGRGAPT